MLAKFTQKAFASLVVLLNFLLLSQSHAGFNAGTLLQAHGATLLTGAQLGYEASSQTTSLKFRLPLLVHPNGQVVYPGIDKTPGPYFYHRESSALFALKEISYQSGQNRLGISDTPLQNNHNALLWGNPFGDRNAPYVRSGVVISVNNFELRSSSLTDPHLFFTRYQATPFYESRVFALQQLIIAPQLFTQLENGRTTTGAGLHLQTYFVNFSETRLGAEENISLAVRNQAVTWQNSTGLLVEFFYITLGGGWISQAQDHPFGPFLSYTYGGRTAMPFHGNGVRHGTYLSLNNTFARENSIFIKGEFYEDNIFSLRLDYEKKIGRVVYLLGLLREGIGAPNHSEKLTDPDMFFVFSLRYQAVKDTLNFVSENYYSYSGSMAYRGSLGLALLF